MAPGGLTAQAVADLVGGRLLGDGGARVTAVGTLEAAGPETLSLLAAPRYLAAFRGSNAGAVLISEALASEPGGPSTRIVVPDPHLAIAVVARALWGEPAQPDGVDPTARIGRGARLGPGLVLGPHVVIGAGAAIGARSVLEAGAVIGPGVTLGEECRIGPNAVCYPGTVLGERVVLKAGAVVGGPGFGFSSEGDGHQKLPHLGRCLLEDDVEIGSASCVDRGSLDDTVIGAGSKVDNLVHIGHNVRLGRRCLVMATTGIAGSVRLGDDVIVAGGVGIADHLEVGARARLSAKSVIVGDVPADATMGGYPARPHREFLRAQAALYRLPRIIDRLETLAVDTTEPA